MQWICPVCTCLHDHAHINVRKARVSCWKCGKSWQIGLIGLTGMEGVDQLPYGNRLAGRSSRVPNTLGYPMEDFVPIIGRIIGRIEFTCPGCGRVQKQLPAFDTGWLACDGCGWGVFVRFILRVWQPKHHYRAPLDWVMEDPTDAWDRAAAQDVASSGTASGGAGADRDGAGGAAGA